MGLLCISSGWRETYPKASIGVLRLCGLMNPENSPALDARKADLEANLRTRFAGMDRTSLKANPTLAAYAAYYKAFKKTYHVQLQIESIAFKGASIPRVAALVEVMFMAELKNMLLTAGHDLDAVRGTPTVDVACGDESYIKLNGGEQTLKAGDMYIHDEVGVLSSILYGPDDRTRINPRTTRALFTVYGPAGIGAEQMRSHLEDVWNYARVIAPDAQVEGMEVLPTG
jgi:DNA/RNA-binding domain of Phe-tRNA-synthetase-like protein